MQYRVPTMSLSRRMMNERRNTWHSIACQYTYIYNYAIGIGICMEVYVALVVCIGLCRLRLSSPQFCYDCKICHAMPSWSLPFCSVVTTTCFASCTMLHNHIESTATVLTAVCYCIRNHFQKYCVTTIWYYLFLILK